MHYKPWSLILLAFFHLVFPVLKIVFYSLLYKQSPLLILQIEYNAQNIFQLFFQWGIFPLAGWILFQMKNWSLKGYIACWVIVLSVNYKFLPFLYRTQQFPFLIGVVLMSFMILGFVIYLFRPSVRKFYHDKNLRWWESAPRFKCHIKGNFKQQSTTLLNISLSGAFLDGNTPFELNSIADLEISALGHSFSIKSEIIGEYKFEGKAGYGLMFLETEENEEADGHIEYLIAYLDNIEAPRNPPKINKWEDFKYWLRRVFQNDKAKLD